MLDKFKYTDKELDELVKSLTILVDTREKNNQHLLDYWDDKGINHKKKALSYGDYSFMIPKNEDLNIPRDIYFDGEVIIERKGSLEEISGNLTKERDRLEIIIHNIIRSHSGLLYIAFGINTIFQCSLCQIQNIQEYLLEDILNTI